MASEHMDYRPETSSSSILALDNVGVTYGSVIALKSISLGLHRGWFAAVLGRSGAGKSTLLRTINACSSTGSETAETTNTSKTNPSQLVVALLPDEDAATNQRNRCALRKHLTTFSVPLGRFKPISLSWLRWPLPHWDAR